MVLNHFFLASQARNTSILLCLLVMTPLVCAQNAGGIFTCVDAKGRTITSDRPIAACLDREQRELNSIGIVKRVVPPSYTAEERAAIDRKRQAQEAEYTRLSEEKRRDRALMLRYPNQAAHDKERAIALNRIDDMVSAINKRSKTLTEQRNAIDVELEFYQNDTSKAPAWLKRRIQESTEQIDRQQRLVLEQSQERQRVTARFDEDLAKLRKLWAK